MAEALNPNFLEELFRLCFFRKSIFEKIHPYLKYQYLPTPELKQIYKDLSDYFALNNDVPTFGVVYEKNKANDKLITVLHKIKDCDIVDPEPIFKQLDEYIKDVKFQVLWAEVQQIYEKGDSEEARQRMQVGSAEIVEFSIFKDSGRFLKVFRDFQRIQLDKQIRKEAEPTSREKLPFGILPCDIVSQGGADRKDTILWIMRSGVGKSTVLKWHGYYAAMLGLDVLHIQLEGSEEEAFDKYTQVWSALTYSVVRSGSVEGDDYERLLDIAKKMVVMQHDICIRSFEQFEEASMVDVRDAVVDYEKEHGKPPDLLLLDSIDLCHPGDGLHYGVDTQSIKMKLQNSSRKFKNICNEFDMRGITATQTSDVRMDVWNDPDRVITRSDSMGDKNIANSYSYVFTGNQTVDEEKNKTMRIYFDKLRYYFAKSRVYPIATNFNVGRFFDAHRTKKLFKDIYEE